MYVCLETKTIHLELVGNFSSEAFLVSFRSFVPRRGKPNFLYSNNVINFVGANKEIMQLQHLIKAEREGVINKLNTEGNSFEWRFISPRAPHFEGIWAKKQLKMR